MALTKSLEAIVGSKAPSFNLLEPATNTYQSLEKLQGKNGTLIAFICNHCPYVQHLERALIKFCRSCKEKDIACIAISSNDPDQYPEDSPENIAKKVRVVSYCFPYLFDALQQTAKDYKAVCTPDFFLYNNENRLFYRGRFDDSSPSNEKPITGKDLQKAVEHMLLKRTLPEQHPSIGCSIKWRTV